MPTICLNMIVKDESAIIADTLANILQHCPIDYWVIADTGSSDNTAEIIQDFFNEKGIAGELLHHPWCNFEHNRQLALDATLGKSDYVLFFDADDRFVGQPLHLPALDCDAYNLKMSNDLDALRCYSRYLLVKNDGQWYWLGVVHEQIVSKKTDTQIGFLQGDYFVLSGRTGARNRNPHKYRDDALILAEAYQNYQDNHHNIKSQTAFFCAQSWRDYGDNAQAIHWYKICLSYSQPYTELKRYLLLWLGKLYLLQEQPLLALDHWWQATAQHPQHAESFMHLAEYYLEHGCPELAFDLCEKAINMPMPDPAKSFHVDSPVHIFAPAYNLARSAMALQRHDTAYYAVRQLCYLGEYHVAMTRFTLGVLALLIEYYQQDTSEHQQVIQRFVKNLKQNDDETIKLQQHFLNLIAE
ncbi:glycosyltransferase [Acinetobacter sp. c1-l78]|uniref:glycosyltransferase n=1 Tax=Acinetobacter sp. c1-l78 TaxID=3342803 RepID=UPI0035B84846